MRIIMPKKKKKKTDLPLNGGVPPVTNKPIHVTVRLHPQKRKTVVASVYFEPLTLKMVCPRCRESKECTASDKDWPKLLRMFTAHKNFWHLDPTTRQRIFRKRYAVPDPDKMESIKCAHCRKKLRLAYPLDDVLGLSRELIRSVVWSVCDPVAEAAKQKRIKRQIAEVLLESSARAVPKPGDN